MNELLTKTNFQENYSNFDNIPIRDNLFQNSEKHYEKEEKNIKKSCEKQNKIELFSEFYQRAEAYHKANKYANIISKDLSQPIIVKENFLSSTRLTQRELNKNQIVELLDYNILKDILLSVGYSTSIRFTIWKFLLSFHGNDNLYKMYHKKGTHKFFENLDKILPVANKVLGCRLKTTCSIIAHWSPQIGVSYFLPNLVFPFVKCIRGEEPFLIDVLVSIITYWCQYWFELYPELPLSHLKIVDRILEAENPLLFGHINKIRYNSQISWEFMKNLYSENLDKEKWLQFVDFLITFNHRPEYLIYFNAVYLLNQEAALKNCKNSSDLDKFLYSIHNVNMLKLINQTISIEKKYSHLNHQIYKPYSPLPENYYPVVHFSQLLEYLKTVSDLNVNLNTEKIEKKKPNKSFTKSKNELKEKEQIHENESGKSKKNSSKGRFKIVNDIRKNIKKSDKLIQDEENALHKIEKQIHQKEFQQKLNSIDMDHEKFVEEKSKMRKEMRNIETEKANHLSRIKELECKIDELQKNVNYYKQLSEPFLEGDNNISKDEESNDDNSLEKPLKSKNFMRPTDIKSSLQNSVYSQSQDENDQMRSYNLSNTINSNNWKNNDHNVLNSNDPNFKSRGKEIPNIQTQNTNSFNAQNSRLYNNLLLSSNSGSTEQMYNEISPNNQGYIKEINEYQQEENYNSSKRNPTPHFDFSQNKNNQSNRSNRLINSKNSQGLISLNSLSLSDSNSSHLNRNLEN